MSYIVKVENYPAEKLSTLNELLNVLENCKKLNKKVIFKKVMENKSERNITREVRKWRKIKQLVIGWTVNNMLQLWNI